MTTKINQFLDYMVSTWVDTGASRFTRSVWNHFRHDMDARTRRTNNALESFLGRLRKKAGKTHPNLHEFSDPLTDEQQDLEMLLNAGAEPRRKKCQSVRLNRRQSVLKQRLTRGEMDLASFIEARARVCVSVRACVCMCACVRTCVCPTVRFLISLGS